MLKKLLVLGAAFFMLLNTGVKAQYTEYGQNYVKLQFVQPLGEYQDYYNSGFGAEYGRMFQFNMDFADGLIIPGLDITFIQTTFNTGKDHVYFGDDNLKTEGGLIWNLGVKLGPMVTFGLTEGLLADFSIQYAPTVIFGFRKGPVEDMVLTGQLPYDTKSASSVSFAHRVSIKGDIRYAHFLFGLEFLLGGTTFHYGHDIVPAYTNTVDASGNTVRTYTPRDEKDMGLGTLLLNFGFTF
ncbi:MAG: hypothetical protein IJ213_07785 [Bacteroidales bacterium]|nr:hypothetical protein [Bacteroidales bacterium]MBQ9312926.1 hypothetical protein [Bacteroidales bacterium]